MPSTAQQNAQQDIAATRTLGWGEEFRATLMLAGPLAAANLLQMATYTVDVIFITRLGESALAASQLVLGVFGLIVWSLNSLTAAVAPVIAAELGENPKSVRPVRRAMRMALWIAIFSGVAGMALALLTVPIMRVTGQDEALVILGFPYLIAIMFSLIPMVVGNVLRTYVSALGRPIFATAITFVGIFVNAIGNYALIFGNFGAPRLELVGAGIATIITTTTVMLIYVAVIRLDPKLHKYRIFNRWWVPDWARAREIIRIGVPIAMTVIAEAGIFSAAAFLMGRIGAAQLAGHALALQLAALAFQIPFGVGQAVTIRVGYFYGARDMVGITRAGWVAIFLGTSFMAFTALLMVLVPGTLLSIFADIDAPENGAMIGFAMQYLVLAAAFQLVDGVQAVALGALRGLQDTRVPMWIATFSYWVPGFGAALGLGFYTPLQGTGVWIGLATGLAFAAVLLLWRWTARERLGLTFRPRAKRSETV